MFSHVSAPLYREQRANSTAGQAGATEDGCYLEVAHDGTTEEQNHEVCSVVDEGVDAVCLVGDQGPEETG